MTPVRYQPRCIKSRKNHAWDLDGRCLYCGKKQVTGQQRAKEWRLRRATSPSEQK